MALNLEAIFKITTKVRDEGLAKLAGGLEKAGNAADGAQKSFKGVAGSALWQGAAAGAALLAAGVGLATKAAIDFESSMSDVRKVVAGLESPESLKQIRDDILELSSAMPVTAKGFAEIYAAAGQSGIAKEELKGFAKLVAEVSTAFDMTAEEAGTSLSQLKAALALTTDEVRDLADGMNFLSNSTTSAANLVEFMNRAGAAGKIAGLSALQTTAFGAAMIQAGVESRVAATSFRNIVGALSAGASMTETQVDALRRLGFTMADAASEERRLTDAAQRESDKRMDQYREESEQLLKEISRRYRGQQQALDDATEDESRAFEKALRKRTDAQIRAIEQNETLSEEAKRQRVDAIRDEIDQELTARRRADRDRRQAAQDRLDDQQDLERKAVTNRIKTFEDGEKQFMETAKKRAKETGEAMANASQEGFAERMQRDAVGTITDVLSKIEGLAKSQQTSVISDLFGKEAARGLAPLISNLGELSRILGLAGDAQGRFGSVSREAAIRAETAAAQIQVLWNKLQNLAILVGEQVLPFLAKVTEGLGPLIDAAGEFVKANPGLTAAAVAIGSIAAAVTLALPLIAALITSVGIVSTALAGIGLAALGPIAAVAGAIAGLAALFVVAWQRFEWFRDGITQGLEGIALGWEGAFDIIKGIIIGDSKLIEEGWSKMMSGIGIATARGFDLVKEYAWTVLQWLVEQIFEMPGRIAKGALAIGAAIGDGIASAVRSILTAMFNWIADRINGAVRAINVLIVAYNRLPTPDIPTIRQIPRFAQGGFVDGPTVAMLGDNAGGREYAVPEQKAIGFANNILAGRRGPAAIPAATGASSPPAPAGSAPVTINLTTGPIMQDQNGQRWMTVEDGERLARDTASHVMRSLRTPGGRYVTGVR